MQPASLAVDDLEHKTVSSDPVFTPSSEIIQRRTCLRPSGAEDTLSREREKKLASRSLALPSSVSCSEVILLRCKFRSVAIRMAMPR